MKRQRKARPAASDMSEVKNSSTERWRETEILYSWGSSKGFVIGFVNRVRQKGS